MKIGWKSPFLNFSISVFSSVERNVDTGRSYDQSKGANISNNKIREDLKFYTASTHVSLISITISDYT